MGESRAALKCLESAINDLRAWTADTDVVFPIELACEVVDAFDAWKDAGSGTDSIPKSTGEEVPPPPPGFTGERNKVIGDARDGAHTVRLVEYAFPDGSRVPYAELHETHDGARPGRVMALSALVHLAQNVTDLEVWAIGNRDQRPAEAVPPNEKERAQAERWARTHDATWCDAARAAEDSGQGSRLDVEAAAMLPLVREARKPIDDAHVALDVEVPRQVNGRALSLVERIEILLRGQAYASDLFDKASDERDAARREIERLSKEREELLAEATAATNQISDMHAEIARLRATPAPLTEAALAVVSAWDARAKDGQPVPGGMLLIGNAIERLRNEIRLGCGGSAPLTEAACVHCSAVLPDHSPICVVVSIARDEGFPTISKAYERYASRGDIPTAVRAEASDLPREYVPRTGCDDCGNAPGERHAVDGCGATVATPAVRPEAEPAHRQASTDAECPGEHCPMCNGEACAKCGAGTRSRFGEEPCEHDVMDRHEEGRDAAAATLTREEALRRLDALSPTAARHLASARDWLAAYTESHYRDTTRDKMASILRAYVAGLDAAPVDVPHNLRVDQLSRFAGADVAFPAEEPWTPKVGNRVVTVSLRAELEEALLDPDTAEGAAALLAVADEPMFPTFADRRRFGVTGEVRRPAGEKGWWVRHDDGTEAPYDADELLPVPKEST